MKEAFAEFEELIRVEFDVPRSEMNDEEMKKLFLVAFISGQKEAIINPLNPRLKIG